MSSSNGWNFESAASPVRPCSGRPEPCRRAPDRLRTRTAGPAVSTDSTGSPQADSAGSPQAGSRPRARRGADRRPFRPCAAISSAPKLDPEAISRRCKTRIPQLRNPMSGSNFGSGGAALGATSLFNGPGVGRDRPDARLPGAAQRRRPEAGGHPRSLHRRGATLARRGPESAHRIVPIRYLLFTKMRASLGREVAPQFRPFDGTLRTFSRHIEGM
jgi:hypothetical protein